MSEFVMNDGGNLGQDFIDAPAFFASEYKGASHSAVGPFGAAAGISSVGLKANFGLHR